MKQRILKFSVCDQRITTDDVSVVADSRNYLAAFFTFDRTWDGVEKTAVFSQGEKVFNMLLEGDMCRIPAEVITEGVFYVSVFGGDLITADRVRIEVTESGLLEGVAPPVPTKDIYNQLVERVASEAADAAASAELAALSSQMSQDFAAEAKSYEEICSASVGQVMQSEGSAANSMVLAEQAAGKAAASVSTAQVYAEVAYSSSRDAQTAALDAQTAATRAETAAQSFEWNTLLDITLMADQGGASSLLLAVTDASALANAKRMRVMVDFPVAEVRAAGKFWLAMIIQDKDGTRYSKSICSGSNIAGGANAEYFAMASVELSDIGFESSSSPRTFHSVFQPPNPYYIASANSAANARQITGGYPSKLIEQYAPYLLLRFTGSEMPTFEEGARIVLEVQ